MNHLIILLDDIGSVVTSALILGLIIVTALVLIVVKLTKKINPLKVTIFIVCGLLLFSFAAWLILNAISHS